MKTELSAGEIERLKGKISDLTTENGDQAQTIARLERELAEQKQISEGHMRAWLNRGKEYEKAIARAETAEAQAAEMRVALEECVKYLELCLKAQGTNAADLPWPKAGRRDREDAGAMKESGSRATGQ